jgi:WD40 repeat protein
MGRPFSSSASFGRGMVAVALLVFGCWYSAQPSLGGPNKDDKPTSGGPRKEGKWEVTSLGQIKDRFYYPHFAAQHRLLLAIDRKPAQLWDTKTGKRIAILAGQKKGVDSCAISPDGTKLLTADRLGGWRYFRDKDEENKKVIGWLWIWHLKTGKFLKKIEVDLSAKKLRYSTDWHVKWLNRDKVLLQLDCRENRARASGRTILGHLDLRTGKVLKWSEPIAAGESLRRSPDGKRALAGRRYGVWRQDNGLVAWGGRGTTTRVDLIDLVNLKVIATLGEGKSGDRDWSIVHRCWSKDSRWIATVGSDHTVSIWKGDRGKPVSTIKGHEDVILEVTFSPNGKTLVTASDDETARLWDTASGKQLHVFKGHTAGLNTAVFDARGARLLTGAEDETARLWDVATGKQIRAWGKHESAVRSVGFQKDNQTIWTQTVQGVRRVWKIEDGSLVSEQKTPEADGHRFGVLYLKRAKGGVYEVWAGPPGVPGEGQREDGPPQLQPKFNMRGDSGFSADAISADGKTAASPGKHRTVCLWDLKRWDKVTGKGRTELPTQPSDVWRLAFTPDGKALAVACRDGSVRLWDLATKKQRLKFEGAGPYVRSLVFSPDGTMLAGGSWERRLYLWKVATGKSIMRKVDVTGQFHAVAFSPDGKTLASAGRISDPANEDSFYKPGEIILWNIASGKARQTLTGFHAAVACLAFTPDGKTIIAGDFHGELSFWNVATGKKRAVVRGMSDTVDHLAISPNGKLLVSAHSFSDVVEFWDIASAREIGHFHSPAWQGGSPAFTPDGRTLMITGSRVQFWDVAKLRKSLLPPKAPDNDGDRKK